MAMITEQAGDRLLLSSILSSGICTHPPQLGEATTRKAKRRRRKARREGEEAKKRRLSEGQAEFLEMSFRRERKLDSGRKVMLASEVGLDPKQVAVWFQNRRARWKSKRMEEEYLKLKSAHEAAVLDKCRLEAEVLGLKEQLSEAEKEITTKLSSGSDRVSCHCQAREISSSPTDSFSGEYADQQPPLLGYNIGPGSAEELIYPNEFNCANMLDWANLLGMI